MVLVLWTTHSDLTCLSHFSYQHLLHRFYYKHQMDQCDRHIRSECNFQRTRPNAHSRKGYHLDKVNIDNDEAEQSWAKLSKAEQSWAKLSKAEQSWANSTWYFYFSPLWKCQHWLTTRTKGVPLVYYNMFPRIVDFIHSPREILYTLQHYSHSMKTFIFGH